MLSSIHKINVLYEPIVDIKTNRIRAFEALMRPVDINNQSIDTEAVFESLIRTNNKVGLKALEIECKILQIQNRPFKELPLHLNINSAILFNKKEKLFWANFFKNVENITVELVEYKEENNAYFVFMEELKNRNIPFALDDFLSEGCIYCPEQLSLSNIIKIDKKALFRAREDKHYGIIIKGFIDYCRALNKVVILEGVETPKDLVMASRIGVDCAQGYLYNSMNVYFNSSFGRERCLAS